MFLNASEAILVSNGPPTRLIAADTTFSQLTNGGVAASKAMALRGIQFGPGGTVLPVK